MAPSIPWHQIDTVLLDMDGTLLDLHFDNYFWLQHVPVRYAEAHGTSVEAARQILHKHIDAHRGTLQWYCLEFWSNSLQLDIRALKEEVKHKIQLRPFVREFLQHLRHLNKKLVLITNAHPQSLELKLEVTNIDQWLDLVYSSHQFEQPKESEIFWRRLREQEPFEPSRTLFIDDTESILESAQCYGIQHLLCVHQPDSQTERARIERFAAIDHFDELIPSLTQALP